MKYYPYICLILFFALTFSSCGQQDTLDEDQDQLQYEIEQLKIDIQHLQKRKSAAKNTLNEIENSAWRSWLYKGKIENLKQEIMDLDKEIQDKKLELTFKTKQLKALKNPGFDWRIVYGILAFLVLAFLAFWAYRKFAK